MPRRYLVFAIFLTAYFLSYFFRSTNAVIADDLVRDVGLGPEQLGLMTSLFFLSFAAALLPIGAALDRFGARLVTPALMLAAVAGSAVFAAAQGVAGLALGRALIGLGMAGVLMGALKAFAGWFPPRAFATVSSVFVGLGSLGALAAARPLRLLADAHGWRAVFLGAAAVTLASALLIALFVRDRGAATAREAGATEERAGGFGQIFRSHTFLRIALLNLAVTGTVFAWQSLWAGPYLRMLDRDPLTVSTLLLWIGIGSTAAFLGVGALADRWGLERATVLGSSLILVAQLALLLAAPAWPDAVLAGTLLLFGLGGATTVLFFANARAAFPPRLTGRAVSAVNVFGMGGSALLQWALGVLIGLFPTAAGGAYPPVAYRAALFATALLVAVALVGYLPLLRRGVASSASGETSAAERLA